MTDTAMLSGWGRHRAPGREIVAEDLERGSADATLSRGLGRSYGDSSLPATPDTVVINTTRADRILSFDRKTGRFVAEAGLCLSELNRLFLPQGWFTPVSPGTKFVTLGGMVASDVHGKNQHSAGNFGHHVTRLKMRVADGGIVECTPDQHSDLFKATIGGMGLTGHILEVEFTLKRISSPWIWQRDERVENLNAFLEALERAAPDWPYTAGWIDCLSKGRSMGRGVLTCGRWAEPNQAPAQPPNQQRFRPTMPIDLPAWVLNPLSIRAFNTLYFRRQFKQVREGIAHPDSCFYPLDAIRHWNRMYGKRGFTQYQCVLPRESGPDATRRVLELLTQRGGASFLCVIKDFGRHGVGVLSFTRPGITLALDIPVRDDTQSLIDALNEQVIKEGGRIYLTKDSFTRAEHFRVMETRLAEFERIRDKWDPQRRFKSAQSVRLFGDSP